MDSISYTFLAYFSYSLALLFRSPIARRGYDVQFVDNDGIQRLTSLKRSKQETFNIFQKGHTPWDILRFFGTPFFQKRCVLALSVILFVLQDIVVDPLALRGSSWFLGQIYGYPHYGLYFGVPIANFMGWTVVGLAIFSVFQALDGLLYHSDKPYGGTWYVPCKPLMGPALYFCTMIFNVTITFYIGEYLLGLIGLLISGILLWLVSFRLIKKKT